MILKKTVLRKLRSMPFISPGKTLCITNGHHNPHNFNCLVSGEIRLNDIVNSENGNSVILFNTRPQYPVAGEALTLFASTGVDIKVTHSGFLNIFKKTCWHRRWYSQKGYFLTAWLYPEDQETGKNSIDSIFLPSCSDEVKQVGFDVCIRQHSFCVNIAEKNIQLLFSADSHKEMLDWIKHLNLVIHHFKVWKPEICRSI